LVRRITAASSLPYCWWFTVGSLLYCCCFAYWIAARLPLIHMLIRRFTATGSLVGSLLYCGWFAVFSLDFID